MPGVLLHNIAITPRFQGYDITACAGTLCWAVNLQRWLIKGTPGDYGSCANRAEALGRILHMPPSQIAYAESLPNAPYESLNSGCNLPERDADHARDRCLKIL